MKNLKVIALSALAFVTIASTVFVSCQKQQELVSTTTKVKDVKTSQIASIVNSSPNYSDQELINLLSTTGEIHNKGLDEIKAYLKINYGNHNNMPSKANLYSLINDYSIKFVTTYCSGIELNITENSNIYMTESIKKRITNSPNSNSLSSAYIEAMGDLDIIVDNDQTCFSKQAYEDFVISHISNMANVNEKINLIITANIGFSSLQYWSQNINEWSLLLNGHVLNDQPLVNAYIKKIGKADMTGIIVGGTGGVLYGAIGGTMTFPVVGTIAGAVGCGAAGALSGGLGNSAKAAVEAFFDSFIGD